MRPRRALNPRVHQSIDGLHSVRYTLAVDGVGFVGSSAARDRALGGLIDEVCCGECRAPGDRWGYRRGGGDPAGGYWKGRLLPRPGDQHRMHGIFNLGRFSSKAGTRDYNDATGGLWLALTSGESTQVATPVSHTSSTRTKGENAKSM